jgi:hypothetical protein
MPPAHTPLAQDTFEGHGPPAVTVPGSGTQVTPLAPAVALKLVPHWVHTPLSLTTAQFRSTLCVPHRRRQRLAAQELSVSQGAPTDTVGTLDKVALNLWHGRQGVGKGEP